MRKLLVVAILGYSLLVVTPAMAGPGMFVGVTDDSPKWQESPARIQQVASDLNFSYYRITLGWQPGQTDISAYDAQVMQRAVLNVDGKHILLNVYGKAADAPQDDASRQTFCSYISNVLSEVPQITAVNVWNEVNKQAFWAPQFNPDGTSAAPASYERLMEICYTTIKAAHPSVLVLTSLSPHGNDNPNAASNVSHSPGNFILKMGDAYKADAHAGQIFDDWGQNIYGSTPAERPWKNHPGNTDISEGDYARLMGALQQAFAGTGQPVPGTGGVTIWYLEDGYQTGIDPAKASLYSGSENIPGVLPAFVGSDSVAHPDATSPAPDQATQLVDAIRLAYCQPAVGAFFNFMLADETNLAGWQSGVLWPDWTPKPSYDAFKSAIAEVNAGNVDCSQLKGGNAALSAATPPTGKQPGQPTSQTPPAAHNKPKATGSKTKTKPKPHHPVSKATTDRPKHGHGHGHTTSTHKRQPRKH